MTRVQGDLPAPLTPAECDLRGYTFVPTYGHPLFSSNWHAKALDDGRAVLRR